MRALVEDVALRLRAFVEAEVGTVPVGQQSRARSDILSHESVDRSLRLVRNNGQPDAAWPGILVRSVEVGFRRFSREAVVMPDLIEQARRRTSSHCFATERRFILPPMRVVREA